MEVAVDCFVGRTNGLWMEGVRRSMDDQLAAAGQVNENPADWMNCHLLTEELLKIW